MGLKAVSTSPQTGQMGCSPGQSSCSHLCLTTPQGPVCACPTGEELHQDNFSCFTPQEGGACRAAATKFSAGVLQHCMELQGDTLVSDWCVTIGSQGRGAGKVFHLPCPKARMFLKVKCRAHN